MFHMYVRLEPASFSSLYPKPWPTMRRLKQTVMDWNCGYCVYVGRSDVRHSNSTPTWSMEVCTWY